MNNNILNEIKLIDLLIFSKLLKKILPEVRLRTLINTVNECSNDYDIKNIILENLCESPYIEEDQKITILDLFFEENFKELYKILNCDKSIDKNSYDSIFNFYSYRRMVLSIFSTSKKIMLLPKEKKYNIGVKIYNSKNSDELKMLAIELLEHSEIFDEESKYRIANVIIDSRYDLLLLPEYFDCEDKHRLSYNLNTLQDENVENECSICLGTNFTSVKLKCNHEFCEDCIGKWLKINNLCPLCRFPSN